MTSQNENEAEKKLPLRRLVLPLCFMLVIVLAGFGGFTYCYHNLLGDYPWQQPSSIPKPPDLTSSNQTFEQVAEFMKSEATEKMKFAEGFNCVDYALMVCRNAHWGNITAYPVAIYYEEPLKNHMVVAMPVGEWLVFYEPQLGKQIYPQAGKVYNGEKIKSMYVLIPYAKAVPLGSSPELPDGVFPY